MSEEASFEKRLARLEEIVKRLEVGDLPLEESLALFEEGTRLTRELQSILDGAERRIEILVRQGAGVPSPEPYHGDPEP